MSVELSQLENDITNLLIYTFIFIAYLSQKLFGENYAINI